MFEEGLQVPVKSHKKYSSYQGEITPSVENLLNRDFHADAPNKKWLTDITELSISAGKVYISALVDCFDGMIVASDRALVFFTKGSERSPRSVFEINIVQDVCI